MHNIRIAYNLITRTEILAKGANVNYLLMSIDLHRVPANYPRKIFHVRHSGADVNKLKRHDTRAMILYLWRIAQVAFSGFQQENANQRVRYSWGLKNAESAFTGAYVYNYTHRIHLHKKSPSNTHTRAEHQEKQ